MDGLRPAVARRRSRELRRRFIALAAQGVAIVLLGAVSCVTPPAPPAAASPVVRVVDGQGRESLHDPAEVARRVADKGVRALLEAHLGAVEGALAAPLVLGNDARVLIDGPATHREMFRAIGEARRHVHLETYILETGEPGEKLAALLRERRSAGVDVRVLYDGVGSLGTPREYFDGLREHGVDVCEFNPVNPLKAPRGWRINNRDHRKILVVDGRVAFTGGINISGVYSAGSSGSGGSSGSAGNSAPSRTEGWRDTHVLVEGPVVAEFQRLFLDTWRRQGCAAISDGEFFPPAQPRGEKAMRLVAADPEAGRSEPYIALLSAIEHARRRVWLTYGYFVPDARMLEALTGAARRGVDVRLVLPGFSDFWAPFHAGRSYYDDLLAAGVHVLERRDALLHAKTAVIDGVWSSIGSTNLDWRSFVHNYEADVLVLDPDFAREMEAMFRLDEEAATEIELAAWKKRGLVERMLEWFARRWAYLL